MKFIRFLIEGFVIARKAIVANKTRSGLTMLGVAIGIFLTTGVLSLVNSLENSVTDNLSALGNTTIFVHKWPWKDNSEDWFKYWGRPKVSYKDYVRLHDKLDAVEGVVLDATVQGQGVKYGKASASPVAVIGTTEDMPRVKVIDLREGRHFNSMEFRQGRYVCLLGYEVWKTLFGEKEAVGKEVRIAGKRFLVAGVMAKRGITLGPSEDNGVYLPYEALVKIYNLNSRGIDKVLIIKASSYEEVPYVESEITGELRASRGLKPQADDNFSINKQEMLMDAIGSVFSTFSTAGGVMTAFSLIIGLFSIGLIMYISVRERTKEIGIQKALGATKSFILYQFLAESVVICMAGGVVGLILVFGLTTGLQALIDQNELPFKVNIGEFELILCSVLSIGTGIFAGIIPASIGASMDPVIAIRKG